MKNNKQSRILLHLNIIAVLISITFFSYIYYIVGKDAHAIYFALAALAFGFNIYLISRNQTKAVGILSILYSDMLVLISVSYTHLDVYKRQSVYCCSGAVKMILQSRADSFVSSLLSLS